MAAPTRLRKPRPLTWRGQVSAVFFVVVSAAIIASLGGSLIAARQIIERQGEEHALAIARTTASDPRYAAWVLRQQPDVEGPVQAAAELVRRRTDALYVVVTDRDGVRYSHPNRDLIGYVVSTDPSIPLSGRDADGLERGTLGWSARGKVPLRDNADRVIGSVSVGIPLSALNALQRGLGLVMLGVGAMAMAASLLAAVWHTRRLHRITHGLELEEMADLLREHAAVLGGALEGVVAIDASGRVRLANDVARHYLDADIVIGTPVTESGLPAALADLLTADTQEWPEAGRLVVEGGRILLVRRIKVERHGHDLGTVLVLADRTDLDDLSRELEATRGLTDALRAQAHEYTNRLHVLAGLLHLGHLADAEEYLGQLTGAESRSCGIEDPYLNGMLEAKRAVASELGVSFHIAQVTWVEGTLSYPLDTITVIGNLLDNGIRAAARGPRRPPWVDVSLISDSTDLVVHVIDSGDGVPPDHEDQVFAGGWTTKQHDREAHGLGLALARTMARHHGGEVELQQGHGDSHGAIFCARMRGALRRTVAARQRDTPVAEAVAE